MSQLKLFLFGSPRLEREGQMIEISRRKVWALLTYLTVTRQIHSRDVLATMFWPNHDQSAARANLRRELSRLNKTLGEGQLLVDREHAGFDPASRLWLDVEHFHRQLAECRTHHHPIDEVCIDCLPLLTEAAGLYTDDFLAGFTLSDSPDFDEWQFFQSESLRQALASALERLVEILRSQSDIESAIPHARRRLALDPLHEPAHRQLMELYAQSGQQAAAVRQYNECVRILDEEMGVSPSAETTNLYEAIKTKRIPPQPPQAEEKSLLLPSPPAFPHNLPLQPTPFIGREAELAQIADYLAKPACRLLTLVGPGGIGKTRLAIEAAAAQINAFSRGVTFVPLASVNPADFEDSVNPLVTALANALKFTFHGSKPKTQLLTFLREREMLLVLDNFEHLLEEAHLRETVDLVTDILSHAPQVRIMVTSRERLNLQEEWLFPLEGMNYPAIGQPPLAPPRRGRTIQLPPLWRKLRAGIAPSNSLSSGPDRFSPNLISLRSILRWCAFASWWKGCRWA